MKNGEKGFLKSLSKVVRPRLASVATILLIVVLGSITIFRFARLSRTYADSVMVDQVAELGRIFKKINEQCDIIGFEHDKSYVDFLTVEKFVGSEVGAMNLANPKNWQGPYVKNNPTMQGKLYQILKTDSGYFVAPGVGVRLSNGRTIGKDVTVEPDSDIAAMATEDGPLNYKGRALALKVEIR